MNVHLGQIVDKHTPSLSFLQQTGYHVIISCTLSANGVLDIVHQAVQRYVSKGVSGRADGVHTGLVYAPSRKIPTGVSEDTGKIYLF